VTLVRWIGRLAVAAIVVIGLVTWLSMPPRAVTLETANWQPEAPGSVVRGIYHVHTRRSDGTGSVEDVAAAAGRVGLDFVVLTDHGDATRTPDAPRYIGSVLVIDAVEISTRGGHYAALGLPGPSPYRLGGAPGDVVEDVTRLGGLGIITHPDSPKKSLAWKDWALPLVAFEWLNADSEWRDESNATLARAILAYPFRSPEVIASLFQRPASTLDRWDRLSSEGRYLVAIAGADAHARLGVRDDENGEPGLAVPIPSYESVFRAFSTHVWLDRGFEFRPADDASRLIEALRAGKSYTSIAGIARPARFEFFARTRRGVTTTGGEVPPGEVVTFVARGLAPAGTKWRLLRNGVQVAESSGLELVHEARTDLRSGERGVAFRIEAISGDEPNAVPWIVSNPIFVSREPSPPASDSVPAAPTDARLGIDLRGCMTEKDVLSTSTVEVDDAGDHLYWRWRLAADTSPAWVALACAIDHVPADRRTIEFSAAADEAMRLSVQLRDGGADGHRWARTVYVDWERRTFRVPVEALEPVDKGTTAPADRFRSLLFVVDWVHGRPGMQRAVRLERASFVEAGDQVRTVSSR
jgi:hypothetical protein